MYEKNTSKPQIMGIINLTDDSFWSGSRANTRDAVRDKAAKMIAEGAHILDLGACSTRPGSRPVPPNTEKERILMGLDAVRSVSETVALSIDSYRSEVIRSAVSRFGPVIANDISAGEDDPDMLPMVAEMGLEYIAMHKRGTPETMQSLCRYDDVVAQVCDYFRAFAEKARTAGLREDWILDPGFGFAKTPQQCYEMIERLEEFTSLGQRVLVGISRKSFIYRSLGCGPEGALEETSRLHAIALKKGASLFRVHDVSEIISTFALLKTKQNTLC
ncbi:MAG: dihydropteroate synthase [Bacteroidales bacterium]|nr:dihydropteroate synthase [Bacteroidales bacterium]